LKAIIVGAAAALGFLVLSPDQASARFSPHHIAAPSLVQDVACRIRQVRTVRPNGRVVYRTVRTCTPECRTVRERIVRPNGTIVYRTVRRCW
jgi:hypothetical protein